MMLMITRGAGPLGGSVSGSLVGFGRVPLAQPSVVVVPPATVSASRTGRSSRTLAISRFVARVLFMICLLRPGGRSSLDLLDERGLAGHGRRGPGAALGLPVPFATPVPLRRRHLTSRDVERRVTGH